MKSRKLNALNYHKHVCLSTHTLLFIGESRESMFLIMFRLYSSKYIVVGLKSSLLSVKSLTCVLDTHISMTLYFLDEIKKKIKYTKLS